MYLRVVLLHCRLTLGKYWMEIKQSANNVFIRRDVDEYDRNLANLRGYHKGMGVIRGKSGFESGTFWVVVFLLALFLDNWWLEA